MAPYHLTQALPPLPPRNPSPRLVATRGEVANQVELVAQLQSDVVTAQQQRVAAEERLQSVEATCRVSIAPADKSLGASLPSPSDYIHMPVRFY